MAADSLLSPRIVVSRIAASLLGGYAFMWGFVTLGISLPVALGMTYDDAYHLTMLLAFVVFLVMFCWSFAAASVARVWTVLLGSGAIMTGAAWLLSRALL